MGGDLDLRFDTSSLVVNSDMSGGGGERGWFYYLVATCTPSTNRMKTHAAAVLDLKCALRYQLIDLRYTRSHARTHTRKHARTHAHTLNPIQFKFIVSTRAGRYWNLA